MLHAIGIDFGGTSIKSGLVADGIITHRGTPIDTRSHPGADALVDSIVSVIDELRGEEPSVLAVGVGAPGLVDSVNGIVHELTNVPGWESVALRGLLEQRTGLPVILENDANAMAYGEWKYGAAKNGNHVVCITLGTGVGGALILDGRLYRGAQLGAGEIGHMSIDFSGPPGNHDNPGDLEVYVGNRQIGERAAERYRAAGQPKPVEECTPYQLGRAAASGDPVAAQLWDDLGSELGTALASVVWLLNPDTIVIGGGVAAAGELIFDPVRRAIRRRTQKVIHENLRIVPAALGNDAGIIGNAALALEAAAEKKDAKNL
jgi:glucokinase